MIYVVKRISQFVVFVVVVDVDFSFIFFFCLLLSFQSADYSSSDYIKEEPIKISIRGLRKTFYPPNQHVVIDNSPPDKKLRLQWVHGYRGRDTTKNLWVLPTGEMLYYVAAVAILYDHDEGRQRHYTGHTEDIMTYAYFLFFILIF